MELRIPPPRGVPHRHSPSAPGSHTGSFHPAQTAPFRKMSASPSAGSSRGTVPVVRIYFLTFPEDCSPSLGNNTPTLRQLLQQHGKALKMFISSVPGKRSFLGPEVAKHNDMYFYPVYKICRATGTFTRIGSMMGSCRQRSVQYLPFHLSEARTLFAQRPEDIIVLGPRCADAAGTTGNEPLKRRTRKTPPRPVLPVPSIRSDSQAIHPEGGL